jgi:hypothetical protein
MLVDGVASAVAFVVFLAPGALWGWMAERRRAPMPRSAVLDAGLVALASAAFSTPAMVAVGLLVWGLDRDLSSLESWLGVSPGPSGELAVGYAALLLLQLSLALLTSWLVFHKLGHRLVGKLTVEKVSGWTSVFRTAKPDEEWSAAADILLEDGSVIRGIVEDYTPDHELADREIVLSEPILHEHDGASLFGQRPSPARIVVSGTGIRRIAVHYLKPADVAALRETCHRRQPGE